MSKNTVKAGVLAAAIAASPMANAETQETGGDKAKEVARVQLETQTKTQLLLAQCDFNKDGKINTRSDVRKKVTTRENAKAEAQCKIRTEKEILDKNIAQLRADNAQLRADNAQLDEQIAQKDEQISEIQEDINNIKNNIK